MNTQSNGSHKLNETKVNRLNGYISSPLIAEKAVLKACFVSYVKKIGFVKSGINEEKEMSESFDRSSIWFFSDATNSLI
jgi:hypothetical protein